MNVITDLKLELEGFNYDLVPVDVPEYQAALG